MHTSDCSAIEDLVASCDDFTELGPAEYVAFGIPSARSSCNFRSLASVAMWILGECVNKLRFPSDLLGSRGSGRGEDVAHRSPRSARPRQAEHQDLGSGRGKGRRDVLRLCDDPWAGAEGSAEVINHVGDQEATQ